MRCISHAVLQKSHTHPVIHEHRYILNHFRGTVINKHSTGGIMFRGGTYATHLVFTTGLIII